MGNLNSGMDITGSDVDPDGTPNTPMKKLDELMLDANNPVVPFKNRLEAMFQAFRVKEAALKVAVAAMTEVTKRTAAVDGDDMQEALDAIGKIEDGKKE